MRKKVLTFSSVILIIDQIVKTLVVNFIQEGKVIPLIGDFFSLTYVKNDGAAWNLFSGNRYFLIAVSLLFLYAAFKYFILDNSITKYEFVGYGLIIGGVLGNLIDRIVSGNVVDYLSFHVFKYAYPVFNIADASIVIGTGLILLNTILVMRSKKK